MTFLLVEEVELVVPSAVSTSPRDWGGWNAVHAPSVLHPSRPVGGASMSAILSLKGQGQFQVLNYEFIAYDF